MCKVLLTGGTGFVGKAVWRRLAQEKRFDLVAAVRSLDVVPRVSVSVVEVSRMDRETDWSGPLVGADTVLHCAGRAHVMRDLAKDPLAEFRKVNVEGTLALAHQAAKAGVRRFVFVSSAKVNGASGLLREDEKPDPEDPYGISKMEAERGLLDLARNSKMEVVIIRPPLVYGPGVKGNFATMVRWIRKGMPLPLGAVHNNRSLVALDNLVDFIALCADRERTPRAANQVFLISDGEDVSTAELVRRVARAYGVRARLLPVPVAWLRLGACVLGKTAAADRLLGSLVVDSVKARELLEWHPPVTMDEQLRKMALYDSHP